MKLNIFRLHSYEEFQFWLARNEELREELEELIGEDLGVDEQGLDTLERFLLGRYNDPERVLRLDERGILDAAARQIGLVLLLNVDGAKWAINLENEDRAYFSLPIIRFSDGDEECPLAMAIAAIDRRRGDYLSTVVAHYMENYNTEPDD